MVAQVKFIRGKTSDCEEIRSFVNGTSNGTVVIMWDTDADKFYYAPSGNEADKNDWAEMPETLANYFRAGAMPNIFGRIEFAAKLVMVDAVALVDAHRAAIAKKAHENAEAAKANATPKPAHKSPLAAPTDDSEAFAESIEEKKAREERRKAREKRLAARKAAKLAKQTPVTQESAPEGIVKNDAKITEDKTSEKVTATTEKKKSASTQKSKSSTTSSTKSTKKADSKDKKEVKEEPSKPTKAKKSSTKKVDEKEDVVTTKKTTKKTSKKETVKEPDKKERVRGNNGRFAKKS